MQRGLEIRLVIFLFSECETSGEDGSGELRKKGKKVGRLVPDLLFLVDKCILRRHVAKRSGVLPRGEAVFEVDVRNIG